MRITELNTTLYHLSKADDINKLTPKVPAKVSSRKNAFEDDSIKRISFAPSIDGCILGLQLSKDDFKNGEIILYVYSPIKVNKKDLVSNKKIVDGFSPGMPMKFGNPAPAPMSRPRSR